jgi:uncharacterized protein with HEPN domain
MREAVQRIALYTAGMTYETFLSDTKKQDAVVRNLEILGEAAKNISAELQTKHTAIPWKGIAGTRDRLIHNYFGVNLDIVWEIITIDLPVLTKQIEDILNSNADTV